MEGQLQTVCFVSEECLLAHLSSVLSLCLGGLPAGDGNFAEQRLSLGLLLMYCLL